MRQQRMDLAGGRGFRIYYCCPILRSPTLNLQLRLKPDAAAHLPQQDTTAQSNPRISATFAESVERYTRLAAKFAGVRHSTKADTPNSGSALQQPPARGAALSSRVSDIRGRNFDV